MTFSPIRHIPVDQHDIETQTIYLENAVMNAELLRVNTYEAYFKFLAWTHIEKIAPPVDFDDEITCEVIEEDILKIEMKGFLPFITKEHKYQVKDYYRQLRDHYIPRLNYAIQKRKPNVKFDNAFVLIIQYFPNLVIRDLDNQFKSFIFNSLRATQIIEGDSWQTLSYMEAGGLDKSNPRTNIYVCHKKKLHSVLNFLPE